VDIDVHPGYYPGYYSMVLAGLVQHGYRLHLTTNGFPPAEKPAFYVKKDTLALILRGRGEAKRVVVSADDFAEIRAGHGDWAHLIAKVNVAPSTGATFGGATVMPVGPLFAIRFGGLAGFGRTVVAKAALTPPSLRTQFDLREEMRKHFKRAPEVSYRPSNSDPSYVFFAGTSWGEHPDVAPLRAAFIRACRRQDGLRFEGGFVAHNNQPETDYPGLYVHHRYSMGDYLMKTGKSLLVFNNPAVHGCLGWKLGEFLALGKAIVSTPLNRVMPGSFEPDEHYLLTDGTGPSLDEAISRVRRDAALRNHLETRARAYYDEYLAPRMVAARILARAER
jgi:hypothetical protein